MGDRPNDVNDTDLIQAGFCLGLVQGVINTNRIYQSMVGNRALFCTPDSFINNQGVRIVAKYLYEHPEKLHMNDTLLVIMALEDAFPCPRN